MLRKIVIFGAGALGINLYHRMKDNNDIICFADNNTASKSEYSGVAIKSPDVLRTLDFDQIYIACKAGLHLFTSN